jgi:5-methylcytosine-specific restriction endonuclease McrA
MRQNYHRELTSIAIQRINNHQCPSCGKDKREWIRRTDWLCCSTECTKIYYKEHERAYSWQEFRHQIWIRDKGICNRCGKMIPTESEFIADHIIPIELGGSMWGKDNIQTLCVDCNKIKTKEDAGHIAVHRRRQKKKLDEMRGIWFSDRVKPLFMNVSYLENLII